MTVLQFPLDEIRVRERVWPDGGEFWSIDGYRRGRLFHHFGTRSEIGQACEAAYGFAADHSLLCVQIVGSGENEDA